MGTYFEVAMSALEMRVKGAGGEEVAVSIHEPGWAMSNLWWESSVTMREEIGEDLEESRVDILRASALAEGIAREPPGWKSAWGSMRRRRLSGMAERRV